MPNNISPREALDIAIAKAMQELDSQRIHEKYIIPENALSRKQAWKYILPFLPYRRSVLELISYWGFLKSVGQNIGQLFLEKDLIDFIQGSIPKAYRGVLNLVEFPLIPIGDVADMMEVSLSKAKTWIEEANANRRLLEAKRVVPFDEDWRKIDSKNKKFTFNQVLRIFRNSRPEGEIHLWLYAVEKLEELVVVNKEITGH